ncbi:MAG: hypothetical protein WC807_13825, partial [Hyphomicrobium sp.]
GYAPIDDAGLVPATESSALNVLRKYPAGGGQKYRADQPRAPAGSSDGGQWIDAGGGGGGSGSVASGVRAPAAAKPAKDQTRVAGGGARLFRELARRLLAAKPKIPQKLPEFLIKKPTPGKIIGKLDDVTPDERRTYEYLRDLGNDVKLLEREAGKRTPDIELNGTRTELKNISGVRRTDEDGLSAAISSRIMDGRGQASNIIVDATQQPGMTTQAAERAAKRALGADDVKKGIKEITIMTPDGPVHLRRID